ncbi:group III truncated hemoglobin [Neolewinella aurantiaca]|uniref:Group III truncated hemoglobin n=1 Tax=Neolewinella aurantiaca TaxID=2602767 RepID=A0A5C7FVP1_9BACT|nr:group III truncated hemoglobin [Neolewinella aurantiaca]TXF88892.1 group III truncated hemoglobin [Neolewinella aurantiaca]
MTDITHRQDIDQLVAAFYTKATTDPTIGHIFTEVAKLNLEAHLPVIGDFWESVLLGNMVYRGNPMRKHLELAEKTALTQVQFGAWLAMWEETVKELFAGEKAELAVQRAQNIGRLMLHKIDQRR